MYLLVTCNVGMIHAFYPLLGPHRGNVTMGYGGVAWKRAEVAKGIRGTH